MEAVYAILFLSQALAGRINFQCVCCRQKRAFQLPCHTVIVFIMYYMAAEEEQEALDFPLYISIKTYRVLTIVAPL